jgi:hypothetical protein
MAYDGYYGSLMFELNDLLAVDQVNNLHESFSQPEACP